MSSNVTVVPAYATPAVPVIVMVGRLVVPPVLVIATGVTEVTGTLNMLWVVSDDGVSDAVETLPEIFPELIVSVAGTELAVAWPFVLLASEKTVVEGGSLGSIGGLPTAAALVVPVLVLLFGFVFSVCCGRFGYNCFPASYVTRTC